MNQLHKVEREILREFVRICEKHNLTYFLTGGSALGAVRHKGFIPWDDDIDVGMPRDDYERFIGLCADELKEAYYLLSSETKDTFPYQFCKICKKNTLFIEPYMKCEFEYTGIFIDIFPYDNVVNSKLHLSLQQFCWVALNDFTRLLRRVFQHLVKKQTKKGGPDPLRGSVFVSLFKSAKKLQKKIMTYHHHKDTDHFAQWSGGHGYKRETFRKDAFFPPTYLEFEGTRYPCPRDTHAYLTQMYGHDYMVPPSDQKNCKVVLAAENVEPTAAEPTRT